MNHGIATRIVRPSECILGFGIPTSETCFRQDLGRHDKDFAKRFELWTRYRSEFVSDLNTVGPQMSALGVQVVHELTVGRFGALVNAATVFILFSHWNGEAVEFADGLQSTTTVAQVIPTDYAGILDLCVCRSESLASKVRSTRPKCLVRHVVGTEITPSYWLFFMLVLFKVLQNQPMSYLDGVERVVKEFLSGGRRRK